MNYDIYKEVYTPRLVYAKDYVKIDDKSYIEIGLYEVKNNRFYDIVLKENNNEIFIGRFDRMIYPVKAKYKDGRILIYIEEFDNLSKSMKTIEVLSLFEKEDGIFYSCTQEEALSIFDSTIDPSHLKNGSEPIYRSDIEKKKRLKRAF